LIYSQYFRDFIQNTITLLEAKRAKLTPIPASIAKCLVLNGLIESILEVEQIILSEMIFN